jgi:outer membrane biosynthesis protein TonB
VKLITPDKRALGHHAAPNGSSRNMRTFVLAALLMATSAFATQTGPNEAGSAVHSRLAAASAARTRNDVDHVFHKNKGRIYALYMRALRNNPYLRGEIVLSISIAPDGTVTKCTVASSTLYHRELEKQIVEHFTSMNFGAKGAQTFSLEFPITFISTAGAKK